MVVVVEAGTGGGVAVLIALWGCLHHLPMAGSNRVLKHLRVSLRALRLDVRVGAVGANQQGDEPREREETKGDNLPLAYADSIARLPSRLRALSPQC